MQIFRGSTMFRVAICGLVAIAASTSIVPSKSTPSVTATATATATLVVNALSLPRQQVRHRRPTTNNKSSSSMRTAASSSSCCGDESEPRKKNTANQQQQSASASSPSSETATIPEEIFNLVKSIIGAGVLSLPAGIALMATATATATATTTNGMANLRPRTATVLSSSCFLIALMGSISAYTFSLIARVCRMTNSETYADCWKATKGQSLAWIVALSSTLDCLAGNLTYSMVLADTFRQLLVSLLKVIGTGSGIGSGSGIGGPFVAALEAANSRTNVLLLLTTTVLLPLCCVQNLSSLAPFSLVGILGMVYTGVVIGVRFFDGSYALPNGRFLADLKTLPSSLSPTVAASAASASASSVGAAAAAAAPPPLLNPKSLILVSMLSTAYIAHFNAPKFFRELKGASDAPERFHLGVVVPSFAACVLFYSLVSSLGYLTFGSATASMILTNYSTKDVLVSLSRFAVGLSLIFSYPLLFVGLREGIVDLVNQVAPLLRGKQKQQQEEQSPPLALTRSQSNRLTVGLVSLITVLALNITDLTFVASMSGALLGTSLIFVFPTLMFRSALKQISVSTNTPYTRLQSFERNLCAVIAGLGVFIAGVGTRMAWKAAGAA